MRAPLSVLLCLFITFSSATVASERANKQEELQLLKNRIEKLRKTIETKEHSKSSYSAQLRKIEKQIGVISKSMRSTSNKLKSKRKTLKQLKSDESQLLESIKIQNKALSRQLHAAYTLGQQEQVKLLFSQQSAAELQRNLTYYQYFNRSRQHCSPSKRTLPARAKSWRDCLMTRKSKRKI